MFTLGADPEIFAGKDGKFVSAHGLIPGTKEQPFKVEKGAVQVDGLALEFNIDPASSYQEFQGNIDHVLSTLKSMVPDYDFLKVSALVVDPDYRATLPPESLVLGCDPDFNAYTEDFNERPEMTSDIRAVGGHIHVGSIFTEYDTNGIKYEKSIRLARLLDKHVGVYSLLWDYDDMRRTIYGKAGSCRLKSYGVEYRTLSNQWLFDKKLTKFVYDGTAKAVEALHRGEDVESNIYRYTIDTSDRDHRLLKNFSLAA